MLMLATKNRIVGLHSLGFLGVTRRSWETRTYFGPLPSAIDYDDYRKVGSVRLPFIIRRSRAGMTFLQTISELKLNAAIDDSIFKKPVV